MLEYLSVIYHGIKDAGRLWQKGKKILFTRRDSVIQNRLQTIVDLIHQECYETALRELEIALGINPKEFRFWILKARVFDLLERESEAMLYAGIALSNAHHENQKAIAMEMLTQAYSLCLLKSREKNTLDRLIQVQKQNIARFGPSMMSHCNLVISLWEGAFQDPLSGNCLAEKERLEMERESKIYFEKLLEMVKADEANSIIQSYSKQLLTKLRESEKGLSDTLYWRGAIRELEKLSQETVLDMGGQRKRWGLMAVRTGFWAILFLSMIYTSPTAKAGETQKDGIGIVVLEDLI